jgi:glycine C-acetyltransferase
VPEAFHLHLRDELARLRHAGLAKSERILTGPQGAQVEVRADDRAESAPSEVLNFCSNNYLGLANHPEVVRAAREALDRWGFGLASVRFVCGTQEIHRELERRLAEFLGVEDTLLYASCFDANSGVFDTLLTEADAIISDELNHASIINGIRLGKARRLRYRNGDLGELESRLRESRDARFRLIVTDGVFSLEGTIAPLEGICALAESHGALVMVDDSHATGVIGSSGRGSPEHCGVAGRIDLLTGTLGKALGGATGGYAGGRRELIETLRQRSRPYLFSNALPPPTVAGSVAALRLVATAPELRQRLADNTRHFREGLIRVGLAPKPGVHPIVPVMVGDAASAERLAARMLAKGVYVTAFSYPVVPMGEARLRIQLSAAHTREHLDRALAVLAESAREAGL